MNHNPNRSLEMIVSASMDECVYALHTLQSGGMLAQEKIRVKTHRVDEDIVRFKVTITGSGRSYATLRGLLQQDDIYRMTTLMAHVPFKWVENSLLILIATISLGVLTIALIAQNAHFWICMPYTVGIILFSVWTIYINDQNHTDQLLTLVSRKMEIANSGSYAQFVKGKRG